MYFKILKYWAFNRILGLKDFKKFTTTLKNRKKTKSTLKSANVSVCNDTQVDSGVEAFDGHSETCPTWWSTRIFRGTEEYPTDKRSWTPEYWYGCRETFLTPIIPIPICAGEIIIKLGTNLDRYQQAFSDHGRMHSMYDYKDDYSSLVWDDCTTYFRNCDITYKNDELRSVY